ncbi:MAG: MASE1 domain-containing protein [Rhodanobacter sp.]
MYHARVHSRVHHLSVPGPLLGAGYLFAWLLLSTTMQPYWMLVYGLRFGALLLLPARRWGWLLVAELVAAVIVSAAQSWPDGAAGLLQAAPEPLAMAAAVWLLQRFNMHVSLQTPQAMTRLLLSMAVTVIAITATNAVLLEFTRVPIPSALLLNVLGEALLGQYLGMLLIAPLMILLISARPERTAIAPLTADGLLVMLPSMVILMLLSEQGAPRPQLARVLSLAPVLYFAFRHGWRGASLAMITTSLGMTMVDQHLGHLPPGAPAYLFLAVAGTGALLLGSATDALRDSNAKVVEQNVYLGAVNRRLDQLATQLRSAARRNLRADEEQRRHLAAELHDELGQNITAIQTHVKLAQARLHAAGLEDISASVNNILGHMRRALHRLLDDLRPAVLDEFGLLRALDEGPIRDLLNSAGMSYHTEMHGDPRLLDDDTRTAIYRLVQESATNAVKHAKASRFSLRLRIGQRNSVAVALLDLRDNGDGLPGRLPRGGRGLQGMRDRVTSLGGQFRLRPNDAGVHLRILLRCEPAPRERRQALPPATA